MPAAHSSTLQPGEVETIHSTSWAKKQAPALCPRLADGETVLGSHWGRKLPEGIQSWQVRISLPATLPPRVLNLTTRWTCPFPGHGLSLPSEKGWDWAEQGPLSPSSSEALGF